MSNILPEEEHVIKFDFGYFSGKSFYDAVRHLRDSWNIWAIGLDSPTPTDKLVMQIAMKAWSGNGTATAWPKDVADWIYSMHANIKEHNDNAAPDSAD